MVWFGLFIGLVFGKKFIVTKDDTRAFISDAILFGAVSAAIRYGFTWTTLERLSGWCVLLTSFYIGKHIRNYIVKKVSHANPGLHTQPPLPAKHIADYNDFYSPQCSPSNNGYIGPSGNGRSVPRL